MFDHPAFKGIREIDLWRLVVDGLQQIDEGEYGWLKYDVRERGSVKNALLAYDFMLQHVNEPLTEDSIKEIHALCLKNVEFFKTDSGGRRYRINSGEYRNTTVGFLVKMGWNLTKGGLEELQGIESKDDSTSEHSTEMFRGLSLREREPGKYSVHPSYFARSIDMQQEVGEAIAKEIDQYHDEINSTKNPDEKNKIIIRFTQKIEREVHPFEDGNVRTICLILFNKLRLQNGLRPVILENPNCFDGYTIDQIVEEVERGERNFEAVQNGKPYPGSLSTEEIAEKIANDSELNPWLTISIHRAMSSDQFKIANLLIKTGVNINALDEYRNIPLTIAAYYGYIDVLHLLLEQKNVEINKKGQFGGTALYWAAYSNNEKAVKLLIENGADPSIPSALGDLPIQVTKSEACKELLSKKKLDVEELSDNMLLKRFREELPEIRKKLKQPYTATFGAKAYATNDSRTLGIINALLSEIAISRLSIDMLLFMHFSLKILESEILFREKLSSAIIECINNYDLRSPIQSEYGPKLAVDDLIDRLKKLNSAKDFTEINSNKIQPLIDELKCISIYRKYYWSPRELNEESIEYIFQHEKLAKTFFGDAHTLMKKVYLLPKDKKSKIIEGVLKQDELAMACLSKGNDLMEIGKIFPEHGKAIIEYVLKHADVAEACLKDSNYHDKLRQIFPDQWNDISKHIGELKQPKRKISR